MKKTSCPCPKLVGTSQDSSGARPTQISRTPGGVILTGRWHQSGQSMPLEFKKAAVAR
jgi:hypothetical protein